MASEALIKQRELLFRVYAHTRATRQEVGDLKVALPIDDPDREIFGAMEDRLNDAEIDLERILEQLPRKS